MRPDQAMLSASEGVRDETIPDLLSSEKARWRNPIASIMRAASHAAIWAVVLVPILMQIADGWTAVRDDAAISIGSWEVLTPHFPLIGLVSQSSSLGFRRSLFDLGPLLFWVLAIPVHFDSSQGTLWGAALACGLVLSVSVEAAYSTIGWAGAVFVALVTLDLNWETEMFDHLVWNPYMGLAFLIAATAIAWRVATGGFGWWPLVVLTASFAAQCHLVYVAPAVGLIVVSPIIAFFFGMRPSRFRWVFVGCGIAFVCWIAPVVQQLTSNPGNLTALLRSDSGSSRAGMLFGLKALATATTLKPVWLTQFPFLTSLDGQFPKYIEHHNISWALGSLVVLGVITVYARRTRRTRLATISAIAIVVSLGMVVSFASFPKANLEPTGYLANVLWPVGLLIWAIIMCALGGVVLDAWRTRYPLSVARKAQQLLRYLGAVGAAVLLVIASIAAITTLTTAVRRQFLHQPTDYSLDRSIADAIEEAVAPGHVVFEVVPSSFPTHRNGFGTYVIDYWGTAFILLREGWQPAMTYQFYGTATHLTVPKDAKWPVVVVDVDPSTFSVVATHTWFNGRDTTR
jgi:hypothetical protein